MTNTKQMSQLKWSTKGFELKAFDPMVVATVFLVFVAAVGYSLYSGEYLTAATFVAVAAVFGWYIRLDANVVKIVIMEDRVLVNDAPFYYSHYNSWWYAPSNHTIYLQPTQSKGVRPTVALPLGKQDLATVIGYFPKSMIHVEQSNQALPDAIATWLRYQ